MWAPLLKNLDTFSIINRFWWAEIRAILHPVSLVAVTFSIPNAVR